MIVLLKQSDDLKNRNFNEKLNSLIVKSLMLAMNGNTSDGSSVGQMIIYNSTIGRECKAVIRMREDGL